MNSTARRGVGGPSHGGRVVRQRRQLVQAEAGGVVRRREAGWGGVATEACRAWRDFCRAARECRWPRGLRVLCAIRSKWSLPTRLETRTKESNVHASVPVEKPTRVMKVSDAKR